MVRNRRGERLAAVLALPSASAPERRVPGVVLCQGLSGVKHLVLPDVAARLAQRGIASLRFDYSGCGDSEGAKGWIDPRDRGDDALSAFAWLGAHDAVDEGRLGVYGHSYGGPVALAVAARDRRARAVVAVSSPGDGTDMLRALRPSWAWIELRRRVEAERAAIARGAEPTLVDVEELFPFSPAFRAAYEALKGKGGTSAMAAGDEVGVRRFRLASVDAMVEVRPADDARRLEGRALLMVHGADDDVAPIETVAPVLAAATAEPKRLVVVPGAGHNDLDAGAGLALAADHAADWFAGHLDGGRAVDRSTGCGDRRT